MRARELWRVVLLALCLSTWGCSNVTSSGSGLNSVNGEAWYVRTTTVFNLPVATSVWYCAPPGEGTGHPLCTEAKMNPVEDEKKALKNARSPASASGEGTQTVNAGKKKKKKGDDDDDDDDDDRGKGDDDDDHGKGDDDDRGKGDDGGGDDDEAE